MTPLRAGVIGVGHLGQHHTRLYASLPGSHLVGVVDQSAERARMIAERHGAKVFRSVEELLPQVDVVSVAVPTSAHHAVAKACLQAGKHVLIEKPIAVTSAEAQELVQLAAQRRCRLQVGHSERFNPIVIRAGDDEDAPGTASAIRVVRPDAGAAGASAFDFELLRSMVDHARAEARATITGRAGRDSATPCLGAVGSGDAPSRA